MPLVAGDLLAPAGELEPALFPVDTPAQLTERLDGYLQEGYTRAAAAGVAAGAAQDVVARAFSYMRAYDAVLQRIVAHPTTVAFTDEGSSSYSTEQLRVLQRKADYHRAEYEAAVVATSTTTATEAPRGATPTRFSW